MDVAGRRVLIVVPSLNLLGGAERQALLLARLLQESGAAVEVWGKDQPGEVAASCARNGIPARHVELNLRVRWLRLWLNLRRFGKLVGAGKFDWIVPYTTGPNIFAAMTWQRAGAKACIWNQRDEGQRLGIKPVDFKAARSVPILVSNSAHAAQMLVERLGVEPGRTRVIHNGVQMAPPQRSAEAWRQELGVAAGAPLCVMLANLTPRKDHATLVRAWRTVTEQVPGATLVLAGDQGEAAPAIRALASELGLDGSLRFPGAVADVAGLVSAASIGVFSSRLEGCPNGVLECMAAGLAVAGTDIPGIREALGDEGAAHLAPPGDDLGLGVRIVNLLRSPDLRQAEGRRNRRRIDTEFSPARMAAQTVAALKEAEKLGAP